MIISPPSISIVMPAFNAAPYIGAAIDSVLAQTYPGWELVIVNDGSTDDTLAIADSYSLKDNRIRVFSMNAPSGSVYQPRKRAIIEAKASIVSPLGADDLLDAEVLGTLLNRRNETGADIVYPSMYSFTDGKVNEAQLYVPAEPEIEKVVFEGKDTVKFTLDGWRIG